MTIASSKSIIDIAQKLENHLPNEMGMKLQILIQRSKDGEDTTIEIIDLLSPHDNIRRWVREQLSLENTSKGRLRGFGSLAGNPSSIQMSNKWVCPKTSCPESLPVIQEGEDAPYCKDHPLVSPKTT